MAKICHWSWNIHRRRQWGAMSSPRLVIYTMNLILDDCTVELLFPDLSFFGSLALLRLISLFVCCPNCVANTSEYIKRVTFHHRQVNKRIIWNYNLDSSRESLFSLKIFIAMYQINLSTRSSIFYIERHISISRYTFGTVVPTVRKVHYSIWSIGWH